MMMTTGAGQLISHRKVLRRRRSLPVNGEVLVGVGERVSPGQPIAQALLPGPVHPLNAATMLGVPRAELESVLRVTAGAQVKAGQILGQTSSLFGLLKNRLQSPLTGTVESISTNTGQLMLRETPLPIERIAYLPGQVVEVEPGTAVVIEGTVSQVQGIFGLGGETIATLALAGKLDAKTLEPDDILDKHEGLALLATGRITRGALRRMQEIGVKAIVAASAHGSDIVDLLGYELNPASTGGEQIGFTLVLTEGFGAREMSAEASSLLSELVGETTSICGTTQVRAGAVRPEVIGPSVALIPAETGAGPARFRIVRGPGWGLAGQLLENPDQPQQIDTGATVLVTTLRLDNGQLITVPRANIEQIGED